MQGAPTIQQSTLPAQVGPVTARTRCREHPQCSSPRFQHRLDLSPLVQDAGSTNNAAVHTSSTSWTCHCSYKMQGPPTMQQSTLPAQVGLVTTRTRCREHQQCSSPRFQHKLDLSLLVQDAGTTNNAAVHASSISWTCHHSYKMQGAPTMQQSTLPAQVGPVTARTRCRDHQQCSSPRFQHQLDLSPLVQDAGSTNNAAVHASSTGWTCHHSYKMQGAPTMQQSTLPAQVGPVTTRTRCRDHQQCSSPRFQHRLDLSPLVQDAGTTNNAAVHAASTSWTCHRSYKMQGPPTMQLHASSAGWTCHHSYKMQGAPTMQQSTLPAQVGPVTTRTRCRDHQQCSSPRFQHRLDLSPLVQDAGSTNNAAVHASSTRWTCHRSYKMQGPPTMQQSTLPAQVGPVTARTRCRDHQQCNSPRFQYRLDLSPLVQDAGSTNNAAVHASSTSWTCHHSYKMQGPPTMQQSTLPAQVGPVTTRTRCREHQQCSGPRFQHTLDLSPLVQDAGTTNNAAVHASSTSWTCHRSYKMQGPPTMQQSTLPVQVGPVTARTRCRDHQQYSSPRFQHRLDLSPLVQDAGTTNNAAVHASSTGWTCHHSYKMQGPPTMQQSTLPAQVGPATARTRCRDHQQCSSPHFQHRLDLSPLVQDAGSTNNAAVHTSSTGWSCHRSYKMQGPPTMQQSTLPAQVGPVTTRTRCRDHQQCSSPRFQHRLDLSPLVQDVGSTNNTAVHASSTGWTCHRSYKMQGAPTIQQSTLPAQVGPVTARTRCREHQQCSRPRFQHRLDLSPLVQDAGTTNNAAVHASSTGWTCHHSYKMQGPPTMQQSTLPAQVGPVTTRTRCRDHHQQCSSPCFQHRLDLSPLVQDAGSTNNAAVHASSTGWTCHRSYKMQGAPTMQRSTLPAQVGHVTTRTRYRDHQQCSSPRFQHRLDLSPLVQDAGTTNNAAVHASSTGWTCHRSYKMQGPPTMQRSTLPAQVGPVTTRTRCRDHQQCSSPRFQHRLDLSPLVQDAGSTNNAAVHASSTGWTCHHSYKM